MSVISLRVNPEFGLVCIEIPDSQSMVNEGNLQIVKVRGISCHLFVCSNSNVSSASRCSLHPV